MAVESQHDIRNTPPHLVQSLMPECVSYLVDVLCKSVGVPLAEGRAGGAGAPSLDPAEVVPATSLSGAGRGLPSGGDLAWLQPHGPSYKKKKKSSIDNRQEPLFKSTRGNTATLWFHACAICPSGYVGGIPWWLWML